MEATDITYEEDGAKRSATIVFKAGGDEVKRFADELAVELNRNEVPGFRRGHAPRAMLEQGVGGREAYYQRVTENLINTLAWEAIDELDIIYVEEPTFEALSPADDNEGLKFQVEGQVKPVVSLSSYEPVAISMPPKRATDAEVDEQIDALLDYHYSFETITDRGAQEGDYVFALVDCTQGGVMVPGFPKETRLFELGQAVVASAIDKALIGAQAGDKLEFDFTPDEREGHPLSGKGTVHAVIEVNELRRKVVPALDDDFAQRMGVSDAQELRMQVQRGIELERAQNYAALTQQRCVEELSARIEGAIPEAYQEVVRDTKFREFFAELSEQGTTPERWMIVNNVSGDELREQITERAARQVREDLALDALYTHENMSITEQDIRDEFGDVDDLDATLESWRTSGHMATLREAVQRSKAARWLVETAAVTIEQ